MSLLFSSCPPAHVRGAGSLDVQFLAVRFLVASEVVCVKRFQACRDRSSGSMWRSSSSCPVLVLGGRGAGKELVATALHSASNRCVTQRSLVYDRHARFDCRHKVQIGEPDPPQHQPGCDAEHPSRAVARGCHPATVRGLARNPGRHDAEDCHAARPRPYAATTRPSFDPLTKERETTCTSGCASTRRAQSTANELSVHGLPSTVHQVAFSRAMASTASVPRTPRARETAHSTTHDDAAW